MNKALVHELRRLSPDERAELLAEAERVPDPATAEGIMHAVRQLQATMKEILGQKDITAGPQRKTLDATSTLHLRRLADGHEYKHKKWEGMTSTERMAAKLDAEAHGDVEATSLDGSEASIIEAWKLVNPALSRSREISTLDASASQRRGGMPDMARTRMQLPGEPMEWFYDTSYKRD